MKNMKLLIPILCFAVLHSGCKKEGSAGSTSETPDANQVKQQLSQAADTTGAYLNNQKEAILEKANTTYGQLKTDTQQLITNMKTSGQENWEKVSSELDSKLDIAQQKFNDLKEAGDDTLQKTNSAFNAAIEDLKDAYQKAKVEFQKSEEQK
jgi:hypothetical protein